jgi:hypothetical protein
MGVIPSEHYFKIMQFSPKSNFTSGFFIPLQGKKSRYFPQNYRAWVPSPGSEKKALINEL